MTKQSGYVAYFDILGYRSIRPELVMELWTQTSKLHRKMTRELNPNGSYHVFGDSVFIFWPRSDSGQLFLTACIVLFHSMFMGGLPVRGAVASGEYLEEGSVWAGSPIIDAHRCAESLGASACVACPSAKDLVQSHPNQFVKYPLPLRLKGKTEYRRHDLNVLKFLHCFDEKEIKARFSEHGKDVNSPDVCEKMRFTFEAMRAVGCLEASPTGENVKDAVKAPL